jgi:hypothetical protein
MTALKIVGETPELIFDDAVYAVNQEALDEWAAYREEDLKKPLTPRAMKMVAKKLSQWSHAEQMRMVEVAIENNWRGIHYQEPPKQQTTRETSLQQDLEDTSWAR